MKKIKMILAALIVTSLFTITALSIKKHLFLLTKQNRNYIIKLEMTNSSCFNTISIL